MTLFRPLLLRSWPNTLYSPSPTAVNTILYGFFPPNPLNCVIILLEFRLTTFSQSEDKYYNKRELLSSLCQLENGTNSSTHSLVWGGEEKLGNEYRVRKIFDDYGHGGRGEKRVHLIFGKKQ